jgi:hypothetical protein
MLMLSNAGVADSDDSDSEDDAEIGDWADLADEFSSLSHPVAQPVAATGTSAGGS